MAQNSAPGVGLPIAIPDNLNPFMQLVKLSASTMARLVREKEISPVELVQAHFDLIDELNPRLNAFVHLRRDDAIAEARALEGNARNDAGELLGVPVSIKCCIDVAGMTCDAGSRVRQDYVAAQDATLVKRLKAAGAIVLGTTNCAEMLMAYDTDNVLHGRTANPWDLERTAGGSSGGEAAAVASGMSALGVGSDGGGSIRVPAHFTGICGLKPTPGRIPATGHFPPSVGPFATMGVVGPMARSVEDIQVAFSAMAGADIGDPMAADYAPKNLDAVSRRDLRIGILDCSDADVSAETKAAVAKAARMLELAGAEVEPFRSQTLEPARKLWEILFVRVAGGMLVAETVMGRESEISPALRKFLAIASAPPHLTAGELLQTQIERDVVRQQFLTEMQKYDALLLPVCSSPAFRHGEGGWDDSYNTNYLRDMRFSQWFNLFGMPAMSVPISRSPEGLPIGVQVVAHPYQEPLLFRIASLLEAESNWSNDALGGEQIVTAPECAAKG